MHEVGAGPDLDRMMLDGFGEPCNETGPASSGFGPSLDLEAGTPAPVSWLWNSCCLADSRR